MELERIVVVAVHGSGGVYDIAHTEGIRLGI